MHAVTAVRAGAQPPWGQAGDARPSAVRLGLAGLLGLGCGLSTFLDAYYDLSVWGWIGVGLLAITLACVVGVQAPRSWGFWLAVGGLAGLWAWALLSSTWSESTSSAILVANRWLLYAAFLTVATWLVRDRWGALALLGGVAFGGLVLVVYLTANLVVDSGPGLFVERRIAQPIGYTNGLGSYLLAGSFWPAIALAERARPLAATALGAVVASLAASLMLLTESRGVAVAMAVSIIVVLAVVPGRLGRIWLLLLLGAGLAAAAPDLLHVYNSTSAHQPAGSSVSTGGAVALLVAVVVALVWTGGVALARGLSPNGAAILRSVGIGALGVLALGAVVAVVVLSGRISDTISRQYNAFVHPAIVSSADTTTRLSSGAGNRYDLWSVAWRDFKAEPVRGVGAGNWPVSWFRYRVITDDVRQPHSIELQALSELGLVGGVLVIIFAVGVYLGLAGRLRATRGDPLARMLTVAAAGAFTGWLVQTSVDWMQLMPGLTGIALAGAAVLVSDEAEGAVRRRLLPWSVLVAAVLVVGVGGAFLVRQTVADCYQLDGQAELASDPRSAIDDANQALGYDGDNLQAYYLKAAAYARLGDYPSSRATLLAAVRREPNNWITYALLGDLTARARDYRGAAAAYGRASALNPRNKGLRALAANPRAAPTGD
jgi:O-Antigen ligase